MKKAFILPMTALLLSSCSFTFVVHTSNSDSSLDPASTETGMTDSSGAVPSASSDTTMPPLPSSNTDITRTTPSNTGKTMLTSTSSKSSSSRSSASSSSSAASSSSASSSAELTGLGYRPFGTRTTRYHNQPEKNIFSESCVMDTIGDQKLLIIPVHTSEVSFTEEELETIDIAYNGDASETGWQSLRSYYEASSYGELRMQGIMVEPYNLGSNTNSFGQSARSNATFINTLHTITSSYAQEIADNNLDQNGDGYVDAVEFVWKNNGTTWSGYEDNTSVWWAFTSISGKSPNVNSPVVGDYFWSPLSHITNGYYTPNIDVHTLVHETGHLLGADDLYSYDSDTDGCPAGGSDIMDLNVGDHNAVTKAMYGWVSPYIPTGELDEFTITLNDFQSTGDCLMLIDPESWNGTQYDEYFMCEYYTPTGLNESDAVDGYPEWAESYYYNGTGKIYTQPGLKVMHADFRPGNYDSRGRFTGFSSTPLSSTAYVPASNTSTSSGSGYRLMEAIPACKTNLFVGRNGSYRHFGRQDILFGLQSYGCGSTTFNASSCSNVLKNRTTMNSGDPIPWSFTVIDQTPTTITLQVTKL